MFWSSKLKRQGVLGMNARNINYIARYNDRKFYPIVDNKLKTKHAAIKAGLSVPKLLGEISSYANLKALDTYLEQYNNFVIKPSCGSGGKGILVIIGKEGDNYIKSSGVLITPRQIRGHVSDILGGLYSLAGKADVAMIEELIHFDDSMADYSFEGVPDIRIIVFKGFPVMAMLRCATQQSDGKANLHQGAVGVGINIDTGSSVRAVWHEKPILVHPDTEKSFADLQLPHWEQVLNLAAGCYEMTGLGYLGCDVILDQQRGPVLLEINARPGLSIQVANGVGLLNRLHTIEDMTLDELELSIAQRVEFSQQTFTHEGSTVQQQLPISSH